MEKSKSSGGILDRIFAVKTLAHQDSEGSGLKRVLGACDLTMLGIGAIIGAGIFVFTGTAAAGTEDRLAAGPGIVVSFLVTAVACGFAALCYAEFASMIPVSGSAYTYAYASFGELFAWIIGWDLVLEYAVGNIAIAISWSGYFVSLMSYLNIHIPAWLCVDPMSYHHVLRVLSDADPIAIGKLNQDLIQIVKTASETAPRIGGWPICVNVPAIAIVLLVSSLLYRGIQESARVNAVFVALKLLMIALFLAIGIQHLDTTAHWNPFAPNGWKGIMTGAAIIFFAYIGFDSISTAAEEAKSPQRTLPIAIIGSLIICTILYILVAAVLTAMVPLNVLATKEPVAAALRSVGAPGVASIISFGAVLSMASVLLVMQLGQTRVFFAMSRDGLLPSLMSKVHPRFHSPHVSTVLTGLVIAVAAGFIDINIAAELCNIGTLFAFVLVALGVLILRVRSPNVHRGFRTPLVWFSAPMCVATCIALMCFLEYETWIRFGVWLVIGLVIYFCYGIHKSRLAAGVKSASA
jgi:APA family basic amino acid/polyamine antiporter